MKRLIVNADDFGLTEGINRGVLDGHERGIITSASLIANGSAFEAAAAIARSVSSLGVGVHLNLTEGKPVSDLSRIRSLAAGGLFHRRGPLSLAAGVVARRVAAVEVERELRSQIEKVIRAGITPTHLDGHKHFHALPPLSGLVIRLACEYRIRFVRCPRERSTGPAFRLLRNGRSGPAVLKQYVAGRALLLLSPAMPGELRRAEAGRPPAFFGLTQTGFLDSESLREILDSLPEGTSEIMCHPGYVDEELKARPTRLLIQRERELEALTQPGIREFLGEKGIELVHYGSMDA